MEQLVEQIITYSIVIIITVAVVVYYLKNQKKKSDIVAGKIEKAKLAGSHEPVSLHPVIDINHCIQTGACIAACPEKDILGIKDGKATTIHASQCIGHGACFHACPTEAITLCIGTEKRGVELPHINHNFETNISGIFIAGELGGMGLIKNAVEQGKQAVGNIASSFKKNTATDYDLIIVGSGPAGISASLAAKKNNLNTLILEQDSLGGTVSTFPRQKIVMTSAMDLPLYGKVKLSETSKKELLDLWVDALDKNDISVVENSKVDAIETEDNHFTVITITGKKYTTSRVLLAIGRRGTPRKLNIPGENTEKVAYRLLEPEDISGKNIIVVGGGDAGIESALLLADNNKVSLFYRGEGFQGVKPKNRERITEAIQQNRIIGRSNVRPLEIKEKEVIIQLPDDGGEESVDNDLIYIFIGGELPTQFLKKIGLQITKKFGEPLLNH